MEAVREFGDELRRLGWVSDLMIAGSLASGDHIEGVSDLDLVAVTRGPVDEGTLAALHPHFDRWALGCVYVGADRIADVGAEHPTWIAWRDALHTTGNP